MHVNNCLNSNSSGSSNLQSSKQVKFLGIIIDQYLCWDKHVQYLYTGLRKIIHRFVQLIHIMPKMNNNY